MEGDKQKGDKQMRHSTKLHSTKRLRIAVELLRIADLFYLTDAKSFSSKKWFHKYFENSTTQQIDTYKNMAIPVLLKKVPNLKKKFKHYVIYPVKIGNVQLQPLKIEEKGKNCNP